MKKKLVHIVATIVLVLFFLQVPVFLHGEEEEKGRILPAGLSIDISLGAGLLNGVMGEYVYSGGSKKSDLQWDMKSLFSFECQVTLGINERFFFSLRYRYGDPGRGGRATDTDWDLHYPGSLSFSTHDSAVLLYHETEADFTVTMLSSPRYTLSGGLSYLVMALKAEARDGELYEDGVFDRSFSGPVIRYFQGYQIIPLHVDFRCFPVNFLSLGFSFAYTPFLFCSATDIHFLRDIQFDDRIVFGHYIETLLETRFYLGSSVELFIRGEFRWIPPVAGDSRKIALSTGLKESWTSNTAGISLMQGNLLLGAAASFGK